MRSVLVISLLAACDGLMRASVPLRAGTSAPPRAGKPAALVSRRAALGATAAVAVAAVLPAHAAHASDDLLADRLLQARNALDGASVSMANGDVQSVRRIIDKTLKLLTIKGYLGESLKSRVAEMGESEASAVILAERKKLILNLGYLDKYCYSRQTGADASGAPDAERNREDALTALDAILARL